MLAWAGCVHVTWACVAHICQEGGEGGKGGEGEGGRGGGSHYSHLPAWCSSPLLGAWTEPLAGDGYEGWGMGEGQSGSVRGGCGAGRDRWLMTSGGSDLWKKESIRATPILCFSRKISINRFCRFVLFKRSVNLRFFSPKPPFYSDRFKTLHFKAVKRLWRI
jgi:hypothetical protein